MHVDSDDGVLRPQPALLEFLEYFAPVLYDPEFAARWMDTRNRAFLTVIVRTTGRRPRELEEALLCLTAQSSRDFSVLVMIHNPTDEQYERTRRQVTQFCVASGIEGNAHRVHGGMRGAPLQEGVVRAEGRYAAILDDDDYVTADWVEVFASLEGAAPGRVLRSSAAVRVMDSVTGAISSTRVCCTPTEIEYGAEWSVTNHLVINQTPIHAFAFPLFAVRHLGVNFRSDIPVVEDWDFLMRITALCGVLDSERPTAIYNRHEVDTSVRHVTDDDWRIAELSVRSGLERYLLVEAKELRAPSAADVVAGRTSARHKWKRVRLLLDEGGPRALLTAMRTRGLRSR